MAAASTYLAFDLGAESGRAIAVTLDGEKLRMHEAHRFANLPVRLPSGYHWDLTGLWANLVEGLGKAATHCRDRGLRLASLGVDTWGVDYGLLGRSGQLLMLPFAYRDPRNGPAMEKAIAAVGEQAIYDRTGIQFMPFNTLFQLVAQRDAEPATLDAAERVLNMPDLLHYFFSGERANEATIASTTQMIDPRQPNGTWATDLLESLGLPTGVLAATTPAGTKIGRLRDDLAAEAGVAGVDVILPGSHDTASAVAAVPVDPDHRAKGDWAFLSSGTWSLLGLELDEPVISDASREAGFTNERGVGGKIRYLKNISGLWLVQQVRADLAKRGDGMGYEELTGLASEAQPFRTLVDPGHPPFAAPGDMLAKIDAHAEATGQPRPASPGAYVRACLESLALTYGRTLADAERTAGRSVSLLHLVGGGGKNGLLNQMTADAIGRPVAVGPYEGTAIGNALTQAIGTGEVADLGAVRDRVRASFDIRVVEPRHADRFAEEADRFAALVGG